MPKEKSPKQELQASPAKDNVTQVDAELKRLEAQVNELLEVLESIVLKDIPDIEDRLKAAEGKRKLIEGIPKLVQELDNLRNRHKVKADDVRGNKVLSPLEDGSLDDEP